MANSITDWLSKNSPIPHGAKDWEGAGLEAASGIPLATRGIAAVGSGIDAVRGLAGDPNPNRPANFHERMQDLYAMRHLFEKKHGAGAFLWTLLGLAGTAGIGEAGAFATAATKPISWLREIAPAEYAIRKVFGDAPAVVQGLVRGGQMAEGEPDGDYDERPRYARDRRSRRSYDD